jgi:histidine triad (HIT) family protein
MTECVFCRIAQHDLNAKIVDEDGDFIAFHDAHPVAPVHLLVIPKRHVASFAEWTGVDPDVAGRWLLRARDLAASCGFAGAGYRVVINTGAEGGQTVAHLHLHLLAGRALLWPPG